MSEERPHVDCYAVDVTNWPLFCFVPMDRNTGELTEPAIIADRCPSKLLAAIHADGQSAVDAWFESHPTWHEDHRRPIGEPGEAMYCDDNGIPEFPWEPGEEEEPDWNWD